MPTFPTVYDDVKFVKQGGEFAVMMEDRVPTWSLATEKMTCQQNTPLASPLELVEYRVHNFHEIEFGGNPLFAIER